MRSRLAFGLSMAFDFDYYLIDEVMSVGDAHFKKKCLQLFDEKVGRANVILTSHNMNEIRRLCQIVLLVNKGEVTIFDDVEAGILAYQNGAVTPAGGPATNSSPDSGMTS
jgi:capsular polysaccharide transport system ATP-binding protein